MYLCDTSDDKMDGVLNGPLTSAPVYYKNVSFQVHIFPDAVVLRTLSSKNRIKVLKTQQESYFKQGLKDLKIFVLNFVRGQFKMKKIKRVFKNC